MQILVESHNTEQKDQLYSNLLEDFKELNLPNLRIEAKMRDYSVTEYSAAKGDPVSISAIILALISTGGALTIAVGKDGFLSRIASILDSYIKRKIQIKIKSEDGTEVDIVGPSKNIERILLETLKKESKE